MDRDWLVFHPNPSKPRFRPPPGAVDAHCHVFGPTDAFPYAPERKYTPCDAPAAKLFELRDFVGFERNVIVQATCHGTDNRALLDALERFNGCARGVASVRADVGAADLAALHAGGVRGVRFNFVKRLADSVPREPYRRHIFLASKCSLTGIDGRRVLDGRPEVLRRTCLESLARLRTEVIAAPA